MLNPYTGRVHCTDLNPPNALYPYIFNNYLLLEFRAIKNHILSLIKFMYISLIFKKILYLNNKLIKKLP
jgi:hypothetical protein